MVYEIVPPESGDGPTKLQSVIVPGDGTVTRMVAADNEAGEAMVTLPCPVCGDSDTPGWLPGFVIPV
jgi:hypothetical protein